MALNPGKTPYPLGKPNHNRVGISTPGRGETEGERHHFVRGFPTPQLSFPPNSTRGASRAASGASKGSRRSAPITRAVSVWGRRRMYVL